MALKLQQVLANLECRPVVAVEPTSSSVSSVLQPRLLFPNVAWLLSWCPSVQLWMQVTAGSVSLLLAE